MRGCKPRHESTKPNWRSRSAFIVSRCLDGTSDETWSTSFDMVSKTTHTALVIRGYRFSAIIFHACEIMFSKRNQNVGHWLFVVNHVGVSNGVFCSEYRKPFSVSKNWERRIKVVASEYSLVNSSQNQMGRLEFFTNVLDTGAAFKDYADLYKVVEYRFANIDADTLNYRLSKFARRSRRLRIVKGRCIQQGPFYGIVASDSLRMQAYFRLSLVSGNRSAFAG